MSLPVRYQIALAIISGRVDRGHLNDDGWRQLGFDPPFKPGGLPSQEDVLLQAERTIGAALDQALTLVNAFQRMSENGSND